jgi:hypothetical protein
VNPHACRVVLRRRGPLEVFDLAVRFLQQHPGPFGRLALVLVGPLAPLYFALCWWTEGHPALVLIPLALAPLLQAPATVLAGRLLFAPTVRVRDVLRELARRPVALAQVVFWWTLPFVLGCGVLSWVGSIATSWVTEVALLEEAAPDRARKRFTRLARLHVGVSTSVVFGWYGLTAWTGFAGEVLGQAAVGTVLQLGEPFGSLFDFRATPFLLIGLSLGQVVFGVFRLLAYLDVRTRAEGWDLQVALRALGLAGRSLS